MSDDRTVRTILQRITAIEANWGLYSKRRMDFGKRGSLPTNSMPDHVSGSSEPPMLEQDELDVRIAREYREIRASLVALLLETARIESNMAFVVNTAEKFEGPECDLCAMTGVHRAVLATSKAPGETRVVKRCADHHGFLETYGVEAPPVIREWIAAHPGDTVPPRLVKQELPELYQIFHGTNYARGGKAKAGVAASWENGGDALG